MKEERIVKDVERKRKEEFDSILEKIKKRADKLN